MAWSQPPHVYKNKFNDRIKEIRFFGGQLHIPTNQERHGWRLKANVTAGNFAGVLPCRSTRRKEEGG
jgi:hypothetical protein